MTSPINLACLGRRPRELRVVGLDTSYVRPGSAMHSIGFGRPRRSVSVDGTETLPHPGSGALRRAPLRACVLGRAVARPGLGISLSERTVGCGVKRINSVRRAHGLRAVSASPTLRRSARRYVGRMLRRGYFGHLSRIQASRGFGYLGEVLARSRSSTATRAASVVSAWMNSRTHRAVLMNRRFRYVGIGIGRGRSLGNVVVGHFGAR